MRAENHTPSQATPPDRLPPDRPPLDRPPLDAGALRRAVIRPGGLWQAIEVTAATGSTNADLLAQAMAGAPEGVVLAAEEQAAGRGRMGRTWVSPPRAALTFSLLVRPQTVPPARRGWLPLLAGVAVAAAVRSVAGVQAELKWPNDVLAGPAKLGGILAEAVGDAVVVGIGLNVSTEPAELPPPGPGALPATSLRILGSAGGVLGAAVQHRETPDRQPPDRETPDRETPDRETLLAEILAGFEHRYQAWRQAGGDPERCGLRAEYTRLCGTIGRRVRVERPAGQLLSGSAAGVDPDGRLLVRVSSGPEVAVAAGDVVHVR
jgi:BirA family transcriptional regulator, biotin operon repressor / biotin---[acetyl-CoA-carboxylase] ligase